ncbi:hypothetical protein KC19_VG071200 [Ceratodon purpureus]|uniref:Uncharacterized protein n=1 Tax=Ceratodon purpureus TaxID=3225 RepID=A0A8T0HMV2_CERPU|nr:hypothetical protein KC19_VG071200 [Ceratodon purpureus]
MSCTGDGGFFHSILLSHLLGIEICQVLLFQNIPHLARTLSSQFRTVHIEGVSLLRPRLAVECWTYCTVSTRTLKKKRAIACTVYCLLSHQSEFAFHAQLLVRAHYKSMLWEALTDAQEAYESELDVLANILQLFTPARPRRGLTHVDKRLGRHLRDVMNAKEEEGAAKRWFRWTQRVKNVAKMIKVAEEELASLKAVEQFTRQDCYALIVDLARIWTSFKTRGRKW